MQNEPSEQPSAAVVGSVSTPDTSNTAQSIYPEPIKGVGIHAPEPVLYKQDAESNRLLSSSDIMDDRPVPVVQVLSVKGVEYTMMTLTLWFVAGAMIWALLSLANGMTSFSVLAFPASLLLVCVPIFAYFFLRLRKAELADPRLRFEASKRRLSQFTQIIAFATCLFNIIGFVYLVMTKLGGSGSISIGKAILNLVIVLAVAGGVLVYYWFDEHRLIKG